jgi:hypothetical protein
LVVGVIGTALVVALVIAALAMQPLPDFKEPPPGDGGDVVISVGEDFLSTLATGMARQQEEAIQQVVVDVRPAGRVDMIIRARVAILGLETDLNITMVSTLAVADDELVFTVHRIGVAGLNIPLDLLPASLRAVLSNMEAMVNQEANTLLRDNDLLPVSVTSDDTTLTIAVKSR